MSFFKDHIDAMDAYVPGEQPAAMGGIVKLNQNENPYPPSPQGAGGAAGVRRGLPAPVPRPDGRPLPPGGGGAAGRGGGLDPARATAAMT